MSAAAHPADTNPADTNPASTNPASTDLPDSGTASESRRRFLSVLPGGADAAAWAISDLATRRAAVAVVTTLASRDGVDQLARRWAAVGNPQRAGHLFEVMHAATFDRNAARRGATVRAYVHALTEGCSPNGKVDITLRDGSTFQDVQAKLITDPVQATRAVASPDYAGMSRLVAADRVEAINTVLDKALTRSPDGVYYTGYTDARVHLTDVLDLGGIQSDPVTLDQAHTAEHNPIRWAQQQVTRAAGRQIATGAAAGAATGALIAGLTAAAAAEAARARAGETSAGAAVITVTGAMARNAVRSGTIGALAQTIQVAAKTGTLPAALGTGTISTALADTVTTIATAGIAYARGTIDAPELAARSAAATIRASLVWGGGLAGQTAIPVPVLGALLGGIAGQAAAVLLTQGLQLAIAATRGERVDPDRLAVLEAEAITTIATAATLRTLTHQLAVDHHAALTGTVLPQLAALTTALGSHPDTSLDDLTTLTTTTAARPSFTTIDEFDQWMTDHTTTLTLNPNW